MANNNKNNEDIKEMLNNSKIVDIEVTDELKKSFVSYAMAVNVSRAIPDVRDGLKPVHRRILYAMNEMGNTANQPYKKCARIVGEVLGKYHPHGDTAVYDALVRMAQDFSIRSPLIDGHGNFGSIDGDSPAAMRYTEARMSKLSSELLRDIDKDTVDTYPNFDDTLQQPRVLPARYPNLLVNGADGIAVGMATNIPPHNLNEVIDGTIAVIDNPDMTIDQLMKYIKAPDFPTGGIILGLDGVIKAYQTGSGYVVIRSKIELEKFNNTRDRIIVKEIPYQVNKENLIKNIHEYAVKNKIEGISQINDESDKDGIRIVIDVKKDTDPQYVLNQLYKHTQMQTNNYIKLLSLVDGKPSTLNLKGIIDKYILHQEEVIVRRTQYDLNKALEKEHILKGLVIALANIDDVIAIIKSSKDNKDAQEKLAEKFDLSEVQSNAILEMKLRRLTSLEVEKIKEELKQIEENIKTYREILQNKELVLNIIKNELIEIKQKYSEPRRSEIEEFYEEIDNEDLIEREDVVITISHEGYMKKMNVDEYKIQNRGGVGKIGHKTKDNDYTETILTCNTHDNLLYFTSKGKVFRTKAYVIPTGSNTAKGRAVVNLINLEEGEKVKAFTPYSDEDAKYIVLVTKNGKIKKTSVKEYKNINRNGKKAISLIDNDEVIGAHLTNGENEILIAASNGKIVRFDESQIRPQGRTSIGVGAMKLEKNETIVSTEIIDDRELILTVTENGKGKISKVDDYRKTSRNAKGVKAGKLDEGTGKIACIKLITEEDDAIIVTNTGITIRIVLEQVSILSRNAKGVILKKCKEGEIITSVTIIPKTELTDIDIQKEEEE